MTRGDEKASDMDSDRWCILRTSGGKTLALMTSLTQAGFDAWTPRTLTHIRATKRKPAFERASPIVPTFVFARSAHLADLLRCQSAPVSPHPGFRVLQMGDRVPVIAGRSLAALREEEARADRMYQSQLDANDAEDARLRRIDQLRTEQARRKALRSERKAIGLGAQVTVSDAPAFAGMTGTIESGDGRSYVVGFGGALRLTIEAWQLLPVAVCSHPTHAA